MPCYYYSKDGSDVAGPVGKDDLIKMHCAGILDDSTQVCLEGEQAWNPILTIALTSAETTPLQVKNLLRTTVDLLEMQSYGQADVQATLVFQYEPDNPEAWLCKGIIAAWPEINVEEFGIRNVLWDVWDNVYEKIQPCVLQSERCFAKALEQSHFDPEFRDRISELLFATGAKRLGSTQLRVMDSAATLINYSETFFSTRKRQAVLKLAFAWMIVGVACLNAAYALDPTPEVAWLVRLANFMLLRVKANANWTSSDWEERGLPLLHQLEQRLNSEHPDWQTQVTSEDTLEGILDVK